MQNRKIITKVDPYNSRRWDLCKKYTDRSLTNVYTIFISNYLHWNKNKHLFIN